MLLSMGSQRVSDDLVTEQQQKSKALSKINLINERDQNCNLQYENSGTLD